MEGKGKKVIVAMSGGVDSSVAAMLLKQQGYEVIGVTLKLWDEPESASCKTSRTCCSVDDVSDARSVANKLDIPYFVFNFKQAFSEQVITRFVDTYLRGETPNPCIDCNQFIKFGELFRRADIMEADFIATGHYAQILQEDGRYCLKRGLDLSKDQSYVLYNLTQEQLSRTLLPLGGLSKAQVRELASSMELRNADKPDSQEICFVPDNDYAGFIERAVPQHTKGGDFVDINGNVIGKHNGIHRYTIGQRKGLGSFSKPMYVVAKDPQAGEIVLGDESDLYTKEFEVGDINLMSFSEIKGEVRANVKTRYSAPLAMATLTTGSNGNIKVTVDKPVRAVTPGQAAVFYDGEKVIGGGRIR